MENEIVITFEGDYVRAVANGEKDFDYNTKLWTGIVAACRENACLKVLGVAYTTRPLRTMEAYKSAEMFRRIGVTHEYRIAWVEKNPDEYDTPYFVETVLVNRGFTARLFSDEAQATDWLLSDGEGHDPGKS